METPPDHQPIDPHLIQAKEPLVVPLMAEQLHVGREVIETGRLRVSKQVHEEHQVISAPTVREEIDVRRVPVNQYVDAAPPAVRYEGETMIMPVLREVLVVEKRLLFVEEVHITKRQVQADTTQPVTLRSEELIVERLHGTPRADQAPDAGPR